MKRVITSTEMSRNRRCSVLKRQSNGRYDKCNLWRYNKLIDTVKHQLRQPVWVTPLEMLYSPIGRLVNVQQLIEASKAVYFILSKGSQEQSDIVMNTEGFVNSIRVLLLELRQPTTKLMGLLLVRAAATLNIQYRDMLLEHYGLLGRVIAVVNKYLASRLIFKKNIAERLVSKADKLDLLPDGVRALRALCSGDPSPPLHQVVDMLPTLGDLIADVDTIEICMDACRALSSLSVGPAEHIEAIIDADLSWKIAHLLFYDSYAEDALVIIGTAFKGTNDHVQDMIDNKVLLRFHRILKRGRTAIIHGRIASNIQRKICEVISLLTAGNWHRIQLVIDAKLIRPLVNLVRKCEDNEVKLEAVRALTCSISEASSEQINKLVKQGLIRTLCDHVICEQDWRRASLCINGLGQLLERGDQELGEENRRVNRYVQVVDQAGGFVALQNLQEQQPPTEIGELAQSLLATYYN